jgi:hypothetical protein
MKYIKSILALTAVIAITFSACQTPAQKAEAERLVSESIAVSESVSVSESKVAAILESEKKVEEKKTFIEWLGVPAITKNYIEVIPTDMYKSYSDPFNYTNCYAEGDVTLYVSGAEPRSGAVAPDIFMKPDGELTLRKVVYAFSGDITNPEKLVIPMEYYDNSGNRDTAKDFILTYYWVI